MNNINIWPKDSPQQVSNKLNAILKKAELEVAPAKRLIWENTLEKIYPWMFSWTPTFWVNQSNTENDPLWIITPTTNDDPLGIMN